MLWEIIVLAVLALVLFLAVVSIIRGRKNMKKVKSFETPDKKVKFAYWLLSAVHMWAGILITLCYVIAAVLVAVQLAGA